MIGQFLLETAQRALSGVFLEALPLDPFLGAGVIGFIVVVVIIVRRGGDVDAAKVGRLA